MKYITFSLTKKKILLNFVSYFNLFAGSIQLQNKMKTNFRIICLKNEENRKYREDKLKINNIIVGHIERSDKKQFENGIPNLVYLSARLQDDKNDQKRPSSQNYHTPINRFNQSNSISSRDLQQLQHEKAQEVKRQRQLQIQKYFYERQSAIRNQKNTMKNLLGSINFSPSKHRQKKISRLIKEACKSERSSYKQKQSQRSVLAQNKPQLQSDFHNFLANKNQESQYHPTEEIEDMKLKRLSRVNPEQQIVGGKEIKTLNLFHFLDKKDKIESGKDKYNKSRTSSSNSKIQSFFGKSRIEKIFNFQSNLKTQQQQFEWSKLKDSTSKNKKFFLRTLDL